MCAFSANVQRLFPEDAWLVEEGLESYLAIPLYSAEGSPIGHLGVMHTEPMMESEAAMSMMTILAARAGAELGRKQAEEGIRAMNAELECRVAERTAELSEANESLLREIAERQQAESALAGKRGAVATHG